MEAAGAEVLFPARSTSPTPVLSAARDNCAQVPAVCSLCLSGPAKYTCPRCNAPYCSLGCYRGPRHEACSENFYKEAVLQVLREEQAGARGRRQMEEMLLKLRAEEAMEEHGTGLHESPDEHDAGLWDSLTAMEKKDFHRLLQSGGIGALIPEWKPWWDIEKKSPPGSNQKIAELPDPSSHSNQLEEQNINNNKKINLKDQSQDEQARDNLELTRLLWHGNDLRLPRREHGGPDSKVNAPGVPGLKLPNESHREEQGGESHREEQGGESHREEQGGESHREEQGGESHKITEHPSLVEDMSYDQELDHQKSLTGPVNDHKISGVGDCAVKEISPISSHQKPTVALQQNVENRRYTVAHFQEHKKNISMDSYIPENISEQGISTRSLPHAMAQSTVQVIPPPFNSPLPSLHSLSRNPSPLVKYSLVNAIYGYAFTLQRHNGDLSEDDSVIDFTGLLLSVSGALSSAAVYNSTAHALQSAVRPASDPQLGGDEVGACKAIEATSCILLGDGSNQYALAALAHLSRVLGRARKLAAADEEAKRASFIAKKKCLFLAAWVNENNNCLAVLSTEAKWEHKQYLKTLVGVLEIAKGLQKSWGGKRPPEKKKLIEEVDQN